MASNNKPTGTKNAYISGMIKYNDENSDGSWNATRRRLSAAFFSKFKELRDELVRRPMKRDCVVDELNTHARLLS